MYFHIKFFSVWSLSEVLKIKQHKGGRSNLRNRARWPVIECFKAVTMLPCPFFKSICCLINLLMTLFCCCLLYLLIATISSIYLTLYFLQTLCCRVFNPFCELSLVIGFVWVFFSHALLRLNLLLEYLFNFTTWFFPKQYFNSFFVCILGSWK